MAMTRLENPDIVMPTLISALMIPSAMTMNYPIIVIYGKSGTTKSGILRMGEMMYNIPLVGTTATYAGIRNHIQDYRFTTDEETGESIEKNILITVDDINHKMILGDQKLFGMLKTGSSVSSGNTRISSNETGKNLSFNMACPKALSTCDEKVWTHPDLYELKRRVLIIPTRLTPELKQEFVDKEEINFNSGRQPLNLEVENFWENHISEFKNNYRKSRGTDRELIATLATVYDISVLDANALVKTYRNFIDPYLEKPNPAFDYLNTFLESEQKNTLAIVRKRIQEERSDYGFDLAIKASTIRTLLKEGVEEGIYDSVNTTQIAQIMEGKGYELQQRSKTYFWVKNLNIEIDRLLEEYYREKEEE